MKYMKYCSILSASMVAALMTMMAHASAADNAAAASFKEYDQTRAKLQANKVTEKKAPFTKEQAEIDKKLNAVRSQILGKQYEDGVKVVNEILAIQDLPIDLRVKGYGLMIDGAMAQQKPEKALELIETYLKTPGLSSAQKAWLLRCQSNTFQRLKKFREALDVLLVRLNCDITDNDAFRTKLEIIRLLEQTGDRPLAIAYTEDMVKNTADDNQKAECLYRLIQLWTRTDIPKALEYIPAYAAAVKDNSKVAAAKLMVAASYDRTKMKDNCAICLTVIQDDTVNQNIRTNAFNQYLGTYSYWSRISPYSRNWPFDFEAVIKLAEENILSIKDLSDNNYANVIQKLMETAHNRINNPDYSEKYAKLLLARNGIMPHFKVKAVQILTQIYAEREDFAAAEKLVKDALAIEKLSMGDKVNLCKQYAKIMTWQEKCDDAVKFLEDLAAKSDAATGKQIKIVIANTYADFDRKEDVIRISRELKDYSREVRIVYPESQAAARAVAQKWLDDQTLDPSTRANALQYFLGDNDADRAVRKKYAEFFRFLQTKPMAVREVFSAIIQTIKLAATGGNYAHVFELREILLANDVEKIDSEYAWLMLDAFAVSGKYKDAAEFVKHPFIGSASTISPLKMPERYMLRFCGAMLPELEDKKGSFKKFYDSYQFPADITQKQKSEVLLRAGSFAMNAKKFTAAEEIFQVYESLFKKDEKKVYNVKFVDTPIGDMKGFLSIKDAPVIHYMDRKYGGNMDFLVTDVTTGDRGAAIQNAGKAQQNKPTALQIACDEYGVHMLFTAYDDKAADIKAGLVSAGAYEMYFAPGENQPHFCFLPDLSNGTNSTWDATYNTHRHRLVDNDEDAKKKARLKTQHEFTADGYRYYMSLSWEAFYDKLPVDGYTWEFDNIHWSRFGGHSWNGVKTLHGRDSWGELAFEISPEQLLRIKRNIIYSARKDYLKEKVTTHHYYGAVDRMKAEKPEFYEKCVADLIKKLDSYLPLVKADMDAETINKVFDEAVYQWNEIEFIVDKLYSDYMAEKLFE